MLFAGCLTAPRLSACSSLLLPSSRLPIIPAAFYRAMTAMAVMVVMVSAGSGDGLYRRHREKS